ncbi:MAG: flagellar basal body rod protein FlgB [Planctomycetota bacterium JB042]
MNPIGSDSKVLLRALDGLALRHRVVASNLANQSTPGFKRYEVSFEDQLERAARGGSFEPKVTRDTEGGDADGNNVVPEREVGTLTRVEIVYRTLSQALTMKSALMRAALTSR